MARTTPAQKPRGEHNSTLSCGFSPEAEGVGTEAGEEGDEDVISAMFRGFGSSNRAGAPHSCDLVFCPHPCQACGRPKRKTFNRAGATQQVDGRWFGPSGACRGAQSTEIVHIFQYLRNIRLRKPVARAYIPNIPVISMATWLRPAGRAERKENLS
jgi:hypothetical protein